MRALFVDWVWKRCALALLALAALAFSFTAAALPCSAYADEPSRYLRSGIHTDWESRTVLPDYAKKYYDVLVEGSNPESPAPYLIDSKYFSYSADGDDEIISHTSRSRFFTLLGISYADSEECRFIRDEALAQTYAAWVAFRRDHPEVFWLNGQFHYGRTLSDPEYGYMDFYIFLKNIDTDIRTPSYGGVLGFFDRPLYSSLEGSARIVRGIKQRDEIVKSVLDSFPAQATEADKVRIINEFLCSRNTYNIAREVALTMGGFKYRASTDWDSVRCLNPLIGTKVDALEDADNTGGPSGDASGEGSSSEDAPGEGSSSGSPSSGAEKAPVLETPTSEGLAAAFKVLCDAAGIECVIEDGAVDIENSPCKNEMRAFQHDLPDTSDMKSLDYLFQQWNLVKVDGLWYAVDVSLNLAAYEANPGAPAPCLLVGSETKVNGMPFGKSHQALNNGVNPTEAAISFLIEENPQYSNGPVITNQAYDDAPYHFEARSFNAGDAYGTPVKADATAMAKSFTLGGGAVSGGHWEWENADPTANDTGDFYQVMRYVEDSPAAGGAGAARSADSDSKRVLATALVPFSIDKRRVTVDASNAVVALKTFDGSTQASFAVPPRLVGVLPGDDVVLKTEAFYDDASVGSEKDVAVTYRLMGKDAGHYQLATTSAMLYAAGTIEEEPQEQTPDSPDAPTTANDGAATSPNAPSVPDVSGAANTSTDNPAAEPVASDRSNVSPVSLANATVSLSFRTCAFNGKARTPSVTVKLDGRTLRKGADYTVSYPAARKALGTYRVTVKGCGRYAGTRIATFSIVKPVVKTTKLSKAKAGKKKLTVTWKKAKGNVSGYQVQYATDKKFKKGAKKKYVPGAGKKSTKISKLKAKKKYYVRVRAVYKVGGKTFHGPWSAAKRVRTK